MLMVPNWKVLMDKIGGPTGNGQEKGITRMADGILQSNQTTQMFVLLL